MIYCIFSQDAYKTLVVKYFLSYGVSLNNIKEGYQSGQMGQAVNLLAPVFEGSNPSPSTKINKVFGDTRVCVVWDTRV